MRFVFSPEKFASAASYLASKCAAPTKLVICKLLYFADKRHLLRYGRPITGDTYYKLPHGHVPTNSLDIINGSSSKANAALFDQFMRLEGVRITPKRVDLSLLSKSDIAILDEVIGDLGTKSAAYLRHISHEEPSYKKSERGRPIDFALFFEGEEYSEEIRQLIELGQDERQGLAIYRANV
jgi:uncharacterized phage-associated protein